jgi:hypothetical protein
MSLISEWTPACAGVTSSGDHKGRPYVRVTTKGKESNDVFKQT